MLIRFLALLLPLVATSANALHPLEPLDTSSPRATMTSFFTLSEEITRRYSAYRDSPSPATQDGLWQSLQTATRLFDLSQVPPVTQYEVGAEAYLLLWEVIARLEIPGPKEIPDVPPDKERKPLERWRIPHTEISIVRIDKGSRTGEFLFSADTVEQARSFYEAVRHLPYQRPVPNENLFRTEELLAGWMIPPKWIEALPDWANTTIFGQVLWKWFALLLLFGLVFGVVVAIIFWARRKPWDNSLRAYLRRLYPPVTLLALTILLRYFAWQQINVSGLAAELADYLMEVLYGIAVVWFIWLTTSWIAEAVIASPRINPKSLNAQLIRLIARSIGILAVLVLFFSSAHALGIPVYGLVAGAGVGGLAIALAATSTLENFIGTLNLFADRPIRVGDLCRFDEESVPGWRPVGTVESIGLRSTKIRRFDGALITIPNSDLSKRNIVNVSASDRMLLTTTLGLRYETTDDQLRFLLVELRELLHAHPKTIHTTENPVRVRFVGFGAASLNVAIRVYIRTTNRNEFLAVQEDILLHIMKVVKQAGTGFAFPSQTLYFSRDGGLDDEQRRAAEKQVREWIAAQTLPFPDFSEKYRKQITNTLDYPPEGSPNANS